MKLLIPLMALSIAALSGCANLSAFGRADDNGDGRVSQAEAAGSEELGAVFSSADSDRNGVLDATEFAVAEQLIAGWKAAHGEGGDHGSGSAAHSH